MKVDVFFLIPVSCTRNENFMNFQIFTSNRVTTHRTLPFSLRIFKFDSRIEQNREREKKKKIRVRISPNYMDWVSKSRFRARNFDSLF